MGANNSTEQDSEDERQPDETTFEITYTTGDPLSGMKSYLNKHIDLWEMLELIPKKYITHITILKIQWLPNTKIDLKCSFKDKDKDGDYNIVLGDITTTYPNDNRNVKFSVENKFPDITYRVKQSIFTFTVKGKLYDGDKIPDPLNLLLIPSGNLTKSASKV